MMIKIGCCGYPVSKRRYHETFNLVEINRTFYEYPRESTVKRWRASSPEDFEFTVKANQEITHKFRFRGKESIEAFNKMKGICRLLRADIILIQTPGSFTPAHMDDALSFLESIDREDLTIVWETRGERWRDPEVKARLAEALERLDVIHVTDPLIESPVRIGEIAYFRLHGLGERMYYYQYTDDELRRLYEKVKPLDGRVENIYILFNNLSMFDDARRLKRFIEEGSFPRLAETPGLEYIRKILGRMKFPSEKSVILRKVGWRIIETEDGRQIRLEEALRRLPAKRYRDIEDLINEMRRTGI